MKTVAALSAPVQKQSLSDSVYRQLKDKIVRRELLAGSRAAGGARAVGMLGVNRGAVREAIKRLQQSGLVAVRQGGNHVVLDFQSEGGLELLPISLVDSAGNVNPGVARAALSLRSSLAPDIAASAAEKAARNWRDALDAMLQRMRAAEKDVPALQELALEFWACWSAPAAISPTALPSTP